MAPLVDMAACITRLMTARAVSEDQLHTASTIQLPDGRFPDWAYLTFARDHPVRWRHHTEVLWGERDEVVPEGDILAFIAATGARVQRIDAGHALAAVHETFLDEWLTTHLSVNDPGAGATSGRRGKR